MKRVGVFLIMFAATVALASAALGDRIVTTSGEVFTGQITQEDKDKVVIKTQSGTISIPLTAIETLTKSGLPEGPKIVPETVEPEKAAEAFTAAKAAVAAGDWVKAGGLLEGLLKLEPQAFPHENRLTATAALVTCYLQVKDAAGALQTFKRRAELVTGESDKRRLLAAAEALKQAKGAAIDGALVTRYEEAIEAAMKWKAEQLFEEAKQLGAKATGLNRMDRLERSAHLCLDRLAEADLYVPAFGADAKRRKEVLAGLAANILGAARRAVQTCTEERQDFISRFWRTSAASVKHARAWNAVAARYLSRRQAAEDGVKNLETLAAKLDSPDFYKDHQKQAGELLKQLEDLKYHIKKPGMKDRYKIALRKFSS